MILGDSSYFVALVNREDRWHRDALRLSRSLRERILVTDLTVAEAVTLVGSHVGAKAGVKLFQFFFDDCEVEFVTEDMMRSAMPLWLRFDGRLSVFDCVSVEVMARHDVSSVLSFDSDFDRVRGIERLH